MGRNSEENAKKTERGQRREYEESDAATVDVLFAFSIATLVRI